MTTIGIDPGFWLTFMGLASSSMMCHSNLTNQQRYMLRKKGVDIPPMKPGRTPVVGYKNNYQMTCSGCGSEFKGLKDPASKRNFCSADCYRSSLAGSSNPNFRGGVKRLKCKGCNADYDVSRSQKYAHIYCSKECRLATKAKNASERKILKRLKDNVRRSILSYIKRGTKNNRKWQSILGYTTVDLAKHLESQFTPEMTWENYGKYWHIDHITPTSWFRFTTPDCEAFRKCWSLNNLQPLEAKANIRKGNKLCLK